VLIAWLEKTQSKKGLLFLLSHKNIQHKSLAWQQVEGWLEQTLRASSQPTVWILPDSVPAHAWFERLQKIQTLNPLNMALLGGDFPPAQERIWKQQLHQGNLKVVILTTELAEKWLKKTTATGWLSFFNTLIWVDCLPSQSVLETLINAPLQPKLQFLNPPMALPPALAEEETPPANVADLPMATGQLHQFTYAVASEDTLLNQLKQNKKTIIVCQNEHTLLACQKLLAEAGIETILSLSASMPWVLFKQHLTDWFTHRSTVLLLEETTLPAWLNLLPVALNSGTTPWHWVWLAPPQHPSGIAHTCESLPFQFRVDCHFTKATTPFKPLSLAWQWLVLQKKRAFNPRIPLPEFPPLSHWGWMARLNRLLYLSGW
jgi:hypothetical protein